MIWELLVSDLYNLFGYSRVAIWWKDFMPGQATDFIRNYMSDMWWKPQTVV